MWAVVEPQTLFRLLELAADDVGELLDLHFAGVLVEGVLIVDRY